MAIPDNCFLHCQLLCTKKCCFLPFENMWISSYFKTWILSEKLCISLALKLDTWGCLGLTFLIACSLNSLGPLAFNIWFCLQENSYKCFLYKAGGDMTPSLCMPVCPSHMLQVRNQWLIWGKLSPVFPRKTHLAKYIKKQVTCGVFLVLSSSIEGVTTRNVLLYMRSFRSNLLVSKTSAQLALNSVTAVRALCDHTALPSLLTIPVPSCSIFTCTCLPINTSLRHTPAVVLLKPTALQPLTPYISL